MKKKILSTLLSITTVILFSFVYLGVALTAEDKTDKATKEKQWVKENDNYIWTFKESKQIQDKKQLFKKIGIGQPLIKEKIKDSKSFQGKFDKVSISDLKYLDEDIGAPRLPVKTLNFLIPYGYEITNIKVTEGKKVKIPGQYLIEPVQAAYPISKSYLAKFTEPDLKYYKLDEEYPELPCGYTAIRKMRGYNIVMVNLNPVKYNAKKQTVWYYPEMTIEIETEPMDSDTKKEELPVDLSYQDKILSTVDNPEIINTYQESASQANTGGFHASALTGGPYAYVIITNNALKGASVANNFNDLIQSKINKGLTARIVTVEDDIYPFYTGTETGDNQDKIRQFIRDAYINWQTRWVLLGGDIEIIPARGVYVTCSGYTDNNLPSDLYYACLDSPWNGDFDNLWGEYNDGIGGGDIDHDAEVFIGRAPVSNITEMQNFVRKTIQYDTQVHIGVQKAVWLGQRLDNYTDGSYSLIPIKEQCLYHSNWNITERYDIVEVWNPTDIISDINDNPNIINHDGHSSSISNARLDNSVIENYITNDHPYIMYSQGCYAGAFDLEDVCIAEKHVVDEHGAAAVVMNSRYGFYWPGTIPDFNHYYDLEFWDALLKEHKLHLGEANQDSKDDNSFSGCNRWITFELNLLGDPELSLQLPYELGSGQIHGKVFKDTNGNGIIDDSDEVFEGASVYLDINMNNRFEASEFVSTTDVNGEYNFTHLDVGTYRVALNTGYKWDYKNPIEGYTTVSVLEGEEKQDINFLVVTPQPTEVSFLDHAGNPIWACYIYAYEINNENFLESKSTDTSGKATFLIKKGMQFYFIAKPEYSGSTSYIYSNVIGTPAILTINKPEQLSRLTVNYSSGDISYFAISPHDQNHRSLGLGTYRSTFEFYIQGGTKFYYKLGNIRKSDGTYLPAKLYSDVYTAPFNMEIDLATHVNPDSDLDGITNALDNCPYTSNSDQKDSYPSQKNGVGDACECEGNFDYWNTTPFDVDVDGSDAVTFKRDFGRSLILNPCTNESPCNGDFNCDGDVDGTDASIFKADFGRSKIKNACPARPAGNWCTY